MWRMAIALTLSVGMLASDGNRAQQDARTTFARLADLAGTWSVTRDGRASSPGSYRITGGGKVLIEDIGGMLTTYYLDGNRLLMTHYCGAGNQPRMRLIDASDDRLRFEMFDITNLASPTSYHSTRLEVVFLNKNRVNLAYTGITAGKESTQVFQLSRTERTSAR